MRPQDIKIGEIYRLRTHSNYAFAKAVEVLKPKTGLNPHTYKIVKCHYSTHKDFSFCLIKYFRPCDLVKDK